MIRPATIILCFCLLFAGCMTNQTSDRHNDVSRKIAKLRAESENNAAIGDNIRITVNFLTTSVVDHFAIDSLMQYVDRNVSVSKSPGIYSQSGLRIGLAGENFHSQLNITKRQLKSSEETELFLVLADGATGNIFIGKEITVPRFFYFGRWYRAVEYEFLRAGRSLRVSARKLPSGLIDIELTPVFSRFLDNGGSLELTELTTRVATSPGKTLVIGGGDTAGENVATALLGYSKMGEKKQTLITVTPHIR